jgi:hypothetical protein
VTIDGESLQIDIRAWNGREFTSTGVKQFEQSEQGWLPVGA